MILPSPGDEVLEGFDRVEGHAVQSSVFAASGLSSCATSGGDYDDAAGEQELTGHHDLASPAASYQIV